LKRSLGKIKRSGNEVASKAAEYLEGTLGVLHRIINEQGKRAVERHWMLRISGNKKQKSRPKDARTYSYVSPRYEDHGRYVYYRWTRYHFRATKGGRQRYAVPVEASKENRYDLRKLQGRAAIWERPAISATEKYLARIRETNKLLVEASYLLERLTNNIAELARMDIDHYELIREQIMELGYTMLEYEELEDHYLGKLKRAKMEGVDLLPLVNSPAFDVDRFLQPPQYAHQLRDAEETKSGLPEPEEPEADEWAPELPPEEPETLESEEMEDGPPDPDVLDKLHNPWKYE